MTNDEIAYLIGMTTTTLNKALHFECRISPFTALFAVKLKIAEVQPRFH
jgi:hypothetical protein